MVYEIEFDSYIIMRGQHCSIQIPFLVQQVYYSRIKPTGFTFIMIREPKYVILYLPYAYSHSRTCACTILNCLNMSVYALPSYSQSGGRLGAVHQQMHHMSKASGSVHKKVQGWVQGAEQKAAFKYRVTYTLYQIIMISEPQWPGTERSLGQ